MTEGVITAIVNNVAERKGVEPSELDIVLADHVDIGSIVRLVNAERGSWWLAFEIPEYTVTVWNDGSVLVEPKITPGRSTAKV